jgi:hypothetical protein
MVKIEIYTHLVRVTLPCVRVGRTKVSTNKQKCYHTMGHPAHVAHDLSRPGPLSIPLHSFFNKPESMSGFVSESDAEAVVEDRGGIGGAAASPGGRLMRAVMMKNVLRLGFWSVGAAATVEGWGIGGGRWGGEIGAPPRPRAGLEGAEPSMETRQ